MSRVSQFANPFYVLLLITGAVFAVTCCAYGLMMVQDLRPEVLVDPTQDPATVEERAEAVGNHPLLVWMDKYGFTALMIELGILAVTTVAAIATDDYWTKRRGKPNEESQD